jgi:hypothetical protein
VQNLLRMFYDQSKSSVGCRSQAGYLFIFKAYALFENFCCKLLK